ncbi:MAG TPA: TIM barrel protein, partial [Polyangiaceae bacterium]
MSNVIQSVCVGCFTKDGLSGEQVVRESKAIGYQAVESLGEELWPLAKSLDLKISMLCGHWPLWEGMNHPKFHSIIEKSMLDSIEKAAKNGIPDVLCFSGNRDQRTQEERVQACVELLKKLAGPAEKKGVTLCLELLNSKVDHPDYECDHTSWGIEVIKRVGSPRVKLLYDIYHMQIMEGDLIRTIKDSIQCIGHFHTAGVPGRHEVDESQE